jgi:hypothetical protein
MRRSPGGSGTGLTGTSGLIGLACVTRIQKCDMSLLARINLAVTKFSYLRAKFKDDKDYKEEINRIEETIEQCREKYLPNFDQDQYTADEFCTFSKVLDILEYSLDDILTKSKVIDHATIEEMAVPE